MHLYVLSGCTMIIELYQFTLVYNNMVAELGKTYICLCPIQFNMKLLIFNCH